MSSEGLLYICESSNFAKVRFHLQCRTVNHGRTKRRHIENSRWEELRVTELCVDISSRYKSTTTIGRIISLATKVQFTKYNNTVIHTFCVDCIAHEIYIKCLMLSFYYMRRKMINVHVNYDPMLIFHFCFPPNPSFLSLLAGFGAML